MMCTKEERKKKKQERLIILAQIDTLLPKRCDECLTNEKYGGKVQSYRCDCPASQKIRKLGAKLDGQPLKENSTPLLYTPEEDAFIIQNFGKMSQTKIGAALKRSDKSIHSRIKILKGKGLIQSKRRETVK